MNEPSTPGLRRRGRTLLTTLRELCEHIRMSCTHSVLVIVPAYNEGSVIRTVIGGLARAGLRIVLVDDGSTDGTGEIARRAGATVLRHPVNRGQGAAIQTGIVYALEQGADFIATFDADGQHDPDDIPRMLASLAESGAEVALGSRFLGQARDIPRVRRILLRAATLFTNITTGVHLSDTHNGLRVMTVRAALSLRIRQDGMAHASEIIEQIGSKALKYVEVPVTVRYTDYSRGKGQSSLDALNVLYNLLAGRLR